MRIAFINSNAFWGGAEKGHVTIAAYLKGRGHEVHFFAGGEEVAAKVREHDIPAKIFAFSSDVDPATLFGLYSAFKKIKPHLVIMNSERDLRLAGAAAALAGVKVRIHRKGVTGVKNKARYRWTYRHLRTHTLCVAEAVRKEIVDLGWVDENSLKVIHSGVDLARFTPEGSRNLRKQLGASDDIILVGAVARLSSIKGFEYLIEAMPEVLKVHPTVKCVLAGTGRIEGELKALVSRLALEDAVRFVGFVEDSPDAIRSLDLSIYPSVHTEGLPNSVIESMACGVPVVATPVAGIPEAVDDGVTGILVPPRDSKAITAALISLIGDKERRKKMALASREQAEKRFNFIDKMAELEEWLGRITQQSVESPEIPNS